MNNTTIYQCSGLKDEEVGLIDEWKWWVSGIFQVTVSSIGILGNSLSIPILCSKQMNSIFNRLLVFLAIFDNIHLILAITESIRENHGDFGPGYLIVYAHVLYPVHNANLCCTILMTTVLAMERYLAVSKPVEYHNTVNCGRKWRRIVGYVVPVVLLSSAFNLPKFFELTIVSDMEGGNSTTYTVSEK